MNLRSLAAVLFACAAASAHAGFTKSVVLDGSCDATQPLQDGMVGVCGRGDSGVQGGVGGAPTYYETVGSTTLYAAWSDTPDFKAAGEQKLVPPARRYLWDDEKSM